MNIYVAVIRLEDGPITGPYRYTMAQAEADAKELAERYSGVPHGIIYVEEL